MNFSTLLTNNNINIQSLFSIAKKNTSRNLINIYPLLDEFQLNFLEFVIGLYIINKNELENDNIIFETEHIDFWNIDTLNSFKKIYSFLTYNKELLIDVKYKKDNTNRIQQTQFTSIKDFSYSKETKICLFSGGMDSTSALLKIIENKELVLPIHTLTNGRNLALTKKIMKKRELNDFDIIYSDYRAIPSNISNDIGSLRGLIYLSNAFILSQLINSNEIIFPENGPMMINPQTSDFLVPTRNAHPFFISEYEKIIKRINPKVTINSIFKDSTKSDVILEAKKNPLLLDTSSCFSTWQRRHCGLCYACLIRKFSVIATDLSEGSDVYKNDIFSVKNIDKDRIKDFHQALIFFLNCINDEYNYATNISIQFIPNLFFNNYKKLLKDFSIDILLGAYASCKTISVTEINPLGNFVIDEFLKIDTTLIEKRRSELTLKTL